MMSRSALAGIMVSICVAVALFQLKHKVNEQERELARVNSKIYTTQEAIHILQAEWSFLNEPKRLQMLAEKHLKLAPSETVQLVSYEDIKDMARPKKGTGFGEMKQVKY